MEVLFAFSESAKLDPRKIYEIVHISVQIQTG